MKDLILIGIAGLAGLATFVIIAKKYGSECTP